MKVRLPVTRIKKILVLIFAFRARVGQILTWTMYSSKQIIRVSENLCNSLHRTSNLLRWNVVLYFEIFLKILTNETFIISALIVIFFVRVEFVFTNYTHSCTKLICVTAMFHGVTREFTWLLRLPEILPRYCSGLAWTLVSGMRRQRSRDGYALGSITN